jgi:hypothetical protein
VVEDPDSIDRLLTYISAQAPTFAKRRGFEADLTG